MSTAHGRTAAAAVLAAAVGARVAASEPLDPTSARIAADPDAALRHSGDAWSAVGSLGSTAADGLRDLPLATWYGVGSWLGLPADTLALVLRVVVMVVAVLGAVQLARAVQPEAEPDAPSWAPWAAAILFACGPVLAAASVRSPLEALAVATIPAALAPVLGSRRGWGPAAVTGLWVGVAGLGGSRWGVCALVAVLAAIGAALHRSRGQAVRVLFTVTLGVGWWVWTLTWEARHARDLAPLLAPASFGDGLRDALAWPGAPTVWIALAALAPCVTVIVALALRVPGLSGLSTALLVIGGTGLLLEMQGWNPIPVAAGPVASLPALLAPSLAWMALAGLLAWPPLARDLAARLATWSATWPAAVRRPSVRGALALALVGTLTLSTAAASFAAGREREPSEPALLEMWNAVAAWSASAPAGRVLVVPAREGRASPALAQALATRPWLARSSVPTSGAAATTAVDDVIDRLSKGVGDVGTSDALRRLGVSYVLIRDDRTVGEDRARPAGLIRAALQEQGATRTAVLSAATSSSATTLLDLGLRSETPRVEVWALLDPAEARVYPGAPLTVAGDASVIADLAGAGLSASRAVAVTSGAGAGADEPELLSDSARRRETDQRLALAPLGRDLGADEPRRVVPPEASSAPTAIRRIIGARSVDASSSAADLGSASPRAGSDATAAVDANPYTSWVSAPGDTRGAWWQIAFDTPTDLAAATVQFVGNRVTGFPVVRVRVETDREDLELDVPEGGLLPLALDEPSSALRITVLEVAKGIEGGTVGITEVDAPDLDVTTSHAVAGSSSSGWLLASRPGGRDSCVPAAGTNERAPARPPTICVAGLSVEGPDAGPIRRSIDVDEPTTVDGAVWMRSVETGPAAALADRLAAPAITVTASSVVAPGLDVRPQAAADGDTTTAWRPAGADAQPTLTMTWDLHQTISGLRLVPPDDHLWSTPTRVRVDVAGADGALYSEERPVDDTGAIALPPVRTRSLSVTVLSDSAVASADSFSGSATRAPVAIAEVEIVGGPRPRYDADRRHTLPCGSGPAVAVAGEEVETRLTISAREVVSGATVRARLCRRVDLPAGESSVSVTGTFTWTPLGLLLRRSSPGSAGSGLFPDAYAAQPTEVRLDALAKPTDPHSVSTSGTGEQVLTLAVPADDGWSARANGHPLSPLTVDGWAQGWTVPAGIDEVVVRYSAGPLVPGVVVGAAAWLSLVLAALASVALRRRRGNNV